MIKAIIFDMDGVISDTEHIHRKVNDMVLRKLGIVIGKEERDSYTGIPTKRGFQMILKRYNKEHDLNRAIEMNTEKLKELISNEMEPISGAVALIENVKKAGFKIAVASSTELPLIEMILEKIGVNDKFDSIISGADLENPKPAPDVFLIAARELAVEPKECLVIEDSSAGAKAAKAAGMKCIGFISPHSGTQNLTMADIVLDDLKKISIDLISRM
ncbi:MAG: HAD family phosphatase [Candidatus Aenigmatarchaeota archaeon]